jgi:hypothetical protein
MCSPSPTNNSLSNGFDGNLVTTFYDGVSAGAYFTFTPTGGYSFNSQIRVYNGGVSDTSVKINGGASISLSTNSWTTVATGSGTLTTLAITRGVTQVHGWFAIEIDGKVLVDSNITIANVPSIASTVRANPSAGFSVVTWTTTGSTGDYISVGHGLNALPGLVVTKTTNNTDSWYTAHGFDLTKFGKLDTRDAFSDAGVAWGNGITSSVIGMRLGNFTANNYTHVAYCFAPVEGYSAMGSYVGNASASDAPFVYTGFKIRWLLIKGTTTDYREWVIYDTARDSYNVADGFLYANSSAAEGSGYNNIDLLSNGFKPRGGDYTTNKSGETYIYVAFAEHPFKTARAR